MVGLTPKLTGICALEKAAAPNRAIVTRHFRMSALLADTRESFMRWSGCVQTLTVPPSSGNRKPAPSHANRRISELFFKGRDIALRRPGAEQWQPLATGSKRRWPQRWRRTAP